MRNQDFVLYKKELDSLRKADYAYSKELLAFAKKNPKADVEHLILTSCLLIHDAEKFYGNKLPQKNIRTPNSKKPKTKTKTVHPLDAWSAYEQTLNSVLEIDGKTLQTLQSFDGNFVAIKTTRIQEDVVENNASITQIIENDTDSNSELINVSIVEEVTVDAIPVYVVEHYPIESVPEDIKELEEAEANSSEAFEYDEVAFDNSDENTNEDAVAPHTVESGGFNLKSKAYVAPEELTVDNSIDAKNIVDDVNAESITEVNQEVSDDTNITIHDKEYVAPDELTVDNSINVQNIIISSYKPKKAKRKLFEKKAKPVSYSGVSSDDEEPVSEYKRKDNLDLFKVEDESNINSQINDAQPKAAQVNERTLAEANEYVVGSTADMTIKSKEYSAPEELTIDNSLPQASNIVGSEDSNAIYVETLDNVIESNTEIRIKPKAYEAPQDLIFDNSIEETEKPAEKKRGLFGRKRKQEPEVKVQPVVFLPPKPAEFDMPEATEGFVYKRKSSSGQSMFVETEFIKSYKEEQNSEVKDETPVDATEVVALELDDNVVDVVDTNVYTSDTSVNIDFNELAAEIAKEKLASEQVVYARDKHVNKAKENEVSENDSVAEDKLIEEDSYSEKQKLNKVSNSGFDPSSIIKDIKIIDI